MTILLGISLGIALLALLVCAANLARFQAPPRRGPDAAGRGEILVSVCVPARNESANLEACVEGLLSQRDQAVEVLVYDDQSEDETPHILARLCAQDERVRAIPTEPLPGDWNGKQWGCDRMGRAARGQWLLFTDADVRFAPTCVARAMDAAHACGASLVSTFPRQRVGSLGEALLVPLIHFVLLSYLPFGRMRRTLDPATSAGCGQFLLVDRNAWLAVGGHGAFQASMHDGIKLPRALRRGGFRTDLFDGTELVSCRMYSGLRATWRGFAKNAYEGLGSPILLILFTTLHLLGHVLPWGFLLWAAGRAGAELAGWAAAGGGATRLQVVLAAGAVAAAIVERSLLARRFHQPWIGVALHPVAMLLMTTVQWHSAWLHVAGRRTWRGRGRGLSTASAAMRSGAAVPGS